MHNKLTLSTRQHTPHIFRSLTVTLSFWQLDCYLYESFNSSHRIGYAASFEIYIIRKNYTIFRLKSTSNLCIFQLPHSIFINVKLKLNENVHQFFRWDSFSLEIMMECENANKPFGQCIRSSHNHSWKK